MPSSKGSHGKPSGPTKALEYVAKYVGGTKPKDALAFTEVFRKVFATFNNPSENNPTIYQLVRECEDIQGRVLNIADIEHALCKISRQIKFSGKPKVPESNKQKA
jgi:hypothetical protein